MRRFLIAVFVALTLTEMMVSPLVCKACCPSSEQQGRDSDDCSPWCVSCTCCHLAHTVCPEVPPAAAVSQVVEPGFTESLAPLPVTPPRDILHVPLSLTSAV